MSRLSGFQFEVVVEGKHNGVKLFQGNLEMGTVRVSENLMNLMAGGTTQYNREMRVSELWDVCGRQSHFLLVSACAQICGFGI